GEADPIAFTLRRPKGLYQGPPEMGRFARRLYNLGARLERDLGCPQDIEWTVDDKDGLYLLQSRPITTLIAHNPATGEWNDSLTGDYLWSNANVAEAVPGVMTPLTWSLWRIFHVELTPIDLGEDPLVGNICGRCYANLGLLFSIYRLGTSSQNALQQAEATLGRVPEGMDIPLIQVPKSRLFRIALAALRWERKFRTLVKGIPEFVATSPEWCRQMRKRLPGIQTKAELASLWREELQPNLYRALWMLRAGMKLFADRALRLDADLTRLVGRVDSNALLSNLRGSGELASLGPVVGLSRVARGDMSSEEYRERWGHRGQDELELSAPRPAEDPDWLEGELQELRKSGLDVGVLLTRQRAVYDTAWERFRHRFPQQEQSMLRRLGQVAEVARVREAVRSEAARCVGVVREFALRTGDLAGLGDGIFFLYMEEVRDLLSGRDAAVKYIPARTKTHARYKELPPYPTIIRGRFDPFRWAADPKRRSDIFDATGAAPAYESGTIRGFPGAAGTVEGKVRVLAGPDQGSQLQAGEILVAVTTNVGWTPLFPRAAAIVTDVGAPLSHAAIVARELGIPAVVGCVTATMRLRTGDRVRVDGGRGTVEVLCSSPEDGTGPAHASQE
ncbi:MAG: PEP-utilizing enzyme, partial [Bacillota bacterium]|nr:PEP-utilizing enzyme [Bacillota bacterium]